MTGQLGNKTKNAHGMEIKSQFFLSRNIKNPDTRVSLQIWTKHKSGGKGGNIIKSILQKSEVEKMACYDPDFII